MNRRNLLRVSSFSLLSGLLPKAHAKEDRIEVYRTPYKYPHLLLGPTGVAGDFDAKAVDDPIVFQASGRFYMLYVGFDGIGYQTGLASSTDLLSWKREGLVGPRDPDSMYTKYNLAISTILRDKSLHGAGEAIKVDGKFLAAWNAYPSAGYEEGAALIGLARSKDLRHWDLSQPILRPEDGAAWERGGLYRPDLFMEERRGERIYYLYYNAKTEALPKSDGGGWREQTGVATSQDLNTWKRSPLNPILVNGPRGTATYSSQNPASLAKPAVPDARDSRFASNPFVMRYRRKYAIFYFGFGYERPGRACEMMALGDDPFHFSKVREVLIDTGAPGSIDETFAHKPSLLFHEGALYHFYCAVSGKYPNEVRGIAVARSIPFRQG